MRRFLPYCLMLLPLGFGLLVQRATPGYALLGSDTYPLILTSRVQSAADFRGIFTHIMMHGRYPLGDFYRPGQNLVLAVEYALWGLNPRGYQVISLLLFGVCIMLMFFAARRLMGPAAWAGPLMGAAYIALHPSVLMVLPVVARRVELWVLCAWLLVPWVLPLGTQGRRWQRAIVAGLLVMFAAGAKEIGVLGVMLVFLHQALFGYEIGVKRALRRGFTASIPAVLGVLIYLVARYRAIDSMGGRPGGEVSRLWENVWHFAPEFARGILCPWSYLPIGAGMLTVYSLVLLLMLSGGAFLSAARAADRGTPHFARLLILGWAWLLSTIVFNGLAGDFDPRYVMLSMAGAAIVIAALAEWAVWLLRSRGGIRLLGAAISGVSVVVLLVVSLQASPLFVSYWEWPEATRRETAFLAALESQLRSTPAGLRIDSVPLPYMPEKSAADRPGIPVAAMLADYSVQAWCELVLSEKHVRVVRAKVRPLPTPGPDEIVLVLRYERAAIQRPPDSR